MVTSQLKFENIKANHYLILAGVSLPGAIILLLLTALHGLGISPDSAQYISAANNFASGKGFVTSITSFTIDQKTTPFTLWTPLLPFMLAAGRIFSLQAAPTGAILNSLLIAANSFIVALLIFNVTNSLLWSGIFILCIEFSVTMFRIHSYLLSEPLYMFLSFSGFLFLVSFMENKKRRTLIISAIFISSGCLARYLGVCAALSASLFLLLEKTYEKKRVLRIKNTLTFLSIAAAPILLWLIRNIIVSGAATGRRDAVPGYTGSYLWRLFDTVSGWFIPPQVPFELRVAGLILIILILGAGYNFIQQKNTEKKNKKFRKKQQIQPDNAYLMHILTVYIIVYIGMIFAASKFAKIDPPDDRLLAPLMPCLFALGFLILYKIYQSIETTQFRYAVKAVAAIFLLGTFAGAFVWTRSAYLTGTGGFSRLEWKQSRTVDWLKRNPLPDVLISNCPEAIYLFAGKEAKMLPMRRERIPLDEIMERIVRLNATVIVFDLVKWRDHLISAKELLETGQIKVLQKFDDGMLLGK